MLPAARNLLNAIWNRYPIGDQDGHLCCEVTVGNWCIIPQEGLDECEQRGWIVIHEDRVELTPQGEYWARKEATIEARKATKIIRDFGLLQEWAWAKR